MSADEEATRRRTDPLMEGVTDGVAAGYDALEHVLAGLRESVRQRPGTESAAAGPAKRSAPRHPRTAARRRPPPQRGMPPARDMVDEIAGLVSEMLELGAGLAGDFAGVIDDRSTGGSGNGGALPVQLAAEAGASASVEFQVTNTGATALKGVVLAVTDLIGEGGRIGPESLSFDVPGIDRIRPGGTDGVIISVEVPTDAAPAIYRGIVAASPGDAWAVLELTVEASMPQEASSEAATA